MPRRLRGPGLKLRSQPQPSASQPPQPQRRPHGGAPAAERAPPSTCTGAHSSATAARAGVAPPPQLHPRA
eukprot:CAMPEP_0177357024 /NCGR_PEP_ID=MMETSP0368-20130122/34839_1 /TAXON_ID=447022 ORGANISM="Scrippsiella hangoei-like, Strain SHHI-4" /NCGR_SAMPLE_ID=MMETSP0368 /ASSEMBLY_ACC=CAM_ASM_000363 /LENGTH=69 /DNA_ID=CAMNT_0018819397 /DNA_START=284 /DNA_END=489 /DNA_ORIENTATION=+